MSAPHSLATVRPGLLALGLAFAVVGAGLVASFFVFSAGTPSNAVTNSVSASQLAPDQTQVWTLPAVGSGAGVLTLSWGASQDANVSFWKASPCSTTSGLCPTEPAIVTWNASLSGKWKGTSSVATSYLIAATNQGRADLDFNATLSESYLAPAFGLGTPAGVLLAIASVLLLGTGGIGIFLGLFLPGGIYARRGSESDLQEAFEDEDEGQGDELLDGDSARPP